MIPDSPKGDVSNVKERHPNWFKMKIERRELIHQLAPETAVSVLLACLEYLETGEKPRDLSPIENVALAAFIPDIDEAWNRYKQRVSSGSKGGRPKAKKDHTVPYGADRYHMAPNGTEEETETEPETEEEKEVEESIAPDGAAPPSPSVDRAKRPIRKQYGQYGWVKLSDEEYSRLSNDFGQAELERCIAYIDEAAQSTGNKNKWRDWNLVVRRCHRDRWGLGTGAGKPNVDSTSGRKSFSEIIAEREGK